MDERFVKRKNQLLQFEQNVMKEKSLVKKLGQKLPEDSIRTPKIGEWSLSHSDSLETMSVKSAEVPFPRSNSKTSIVEPNVTKKKNPNPKTSRSKTSLAPPFIPHQPRLTDSLQGEVANTVFPPGTVTTNLNDILKSKYKQPIKPLPPLQEELSQEEPQFLPLEMFDDLTYQEFPIDVLMKDPIAYSKYQQLDGSFYWAKCTVLDYDDNSGLFLIEWDGTGRRKKVARFNIRFRKENLQKFQDRIAHAKEMCVRAETQLRFDSRVANMSTDNIPTLSPDNIQAFHDKLDIKMGPKDQQLLSQLDEEVTNEFKFIINKMEFVSDLQTNTSIPNRDDFLLIQPKPAPIPKNGLVPHEKFDFNAIFEQIKAKHLYAQKSVLRGIQTIWKIFQDSVSLNFLDDHYDQIVSLEDFMKMQRNTLTTTASSFKKQIQNTLEGVMGNTMPNQLAAMKKDREIFNNMVSLTTHMLHTVLLTIVNKNLQRYNTLFCRYTEKTVERIPSQFSATLLTENKHLTFKPSVAEFKEGFLKILDEFEETVNDLPVVKSALVEVNSSAVSFEDCSSQIKEEREMLTKMLDTILEQMDSFIKERSFLEGVLSLDPIEYTKNFDPNGTRTLNEYRAQLTEFNKVLGIIQNTMKEDYQLGAFFVSCEDFKKEKSAQIKELIFQFLTRIKTLALQGISDLKTEFDTIEVTLKKVPNTPEELAAMKKYLEHVYNSNKQRTNMMNIANERFAFLEEFHFETTNEEVNFHYNIRQMPQKIMAEMEQTERTLSVERIRMVRELRSNQQTLESEVNDLTEFLAAFAAKYTDLDMTIEAVDQINEIGAKLKKIREQNDTYSTHEKLFDFEVGMCKPLQKLIEDFTPLSILWNLASEWNQTYTTWMDTPFPQIRADAMNQFMSQSTKKITKLRKDLANQHVLITKVLQPLSEQIDAFKTHVPIITRLRHQGIKTKHWEIISEVVGFKVMPSMELTLQNFLDLNLERWNDKITEIASVAAQEYSLELSLDQMDADLQQRKFVTGEFRDTECFILHEIDDVTSVIDDQLITTQTLLTSPFIAPVKKRATDRLNFLKMCSETLEAWILCQRSWLYLQPIFTGTSIQQKLLTEARDWGTADKSWREIMEMTHEHSEFNTVMHREVLLPTLQKCNELLDNITKGLNEYLETKRLGFPRFFFLSNDELISILSHTKDFDKIQDSMQKLFEYVNSITVTENNEITHMNDSTGETVKLSNIVDGNTPEIEDWLNHFEEEMKATLKDYVADSIPAYGKKKREYWLTEFPAQVVLMTNQIMWTQQVTNVLAGQKLRGLKVLMQKFIEQLESLTALVRQPISRQTRQVVSCLLIFEVHNRDIIAQLIENEVSDVESFEWQKQLRYYWDDETIMVKSINNTYEYSYEYAGNSARLVITPLTDRCYQTLLSAFKQNLSGAPSGPAGTGKTETVRDCAKALGRPCVVYNCSEEVTPEQMSQFFAGLSSSGSWSCFDEFNRINIEVLSVIAQQVRTIQNAISENADYFQLDQRRLKLNVNAAICITMNPGYAGRTELPDNLKAVFRPCAMMVPDFVFISEILLFSGGFKDASVLSVKLVALFDLCRKQLSNAHHYDWGLRAMKAILSTAGKAKRNDLNADEATLLVQVIRDCTAPKLISADIPLFAGIIHDVFPSVTSNKTKNAQLINNLKDAFVELKLQPAQIYIDKCIELYETTLVRHGIMLVGGSMGGKSSSYKALAIAMSKEMEGVETKPVKYDRLNPKAISIAELYGSFNPVTSEWADGVLSKAIRQASFSDQSELKWIIVDGPVDSLWIETMNSLLDDNKVLCLPNNERIQLGPHVKMVFEVDNLDEASPATVSRCGMIYYDPSVLPWSALTETWCNKYEETAADLMTSLKTLFDNYLPKLIQFIEVDSKNAFEVNSNYCVNNMLKLLDCFMQLKREEVQTQGEGDEIIKSDPLNQEVFSSVFTPQENIQFFTNDMLKAVMERAFLFCCVWAFGGIVSQESRPIFDNFFRDLCTNNQSNCVFPQKDTVFDYYADFGRMDWVPWVDGTTNINLTQNLPIEKQFYPTNQNAAPLFFSRLLLSNHHSVLLQGPESSKTLIGKTLIGSVLDPAKFPSYVLPLAPSTQPSNISKFMLQFMHKKLGTFGPLPGQHFLFLIDNLGSVKPEIYGAQPALELLRQFFDHGGWFNTSPVEFLNIIGTSILATTGVAGGGMYGLPHRLTRHFFTIHLPKYEMSTIQKITEELLNWNMKDASITIKNMIPQAAEGIIKLFEQCQLRLLPIPSKLHYIFNLRNIVHIIRGICLVNTQNLATEGEFQRLWKHEITREFTDRFNSINDRKWFDGEVAKVLADVFKTQYQSPGEFLLFNTFADNSGRYKEVTKSSDELVKSCNLTLDEHNRDASKPIDIVLFQEAVVHLSALTRIFASIGGHALLVGVKASGRKCLARLAMYMSNIEPFEIAITRTYSVAEWHEDLKNLLKKCGTEDVQTGFIISDVQIIMPQQLEDISNLMINGEVPQLYERDEVEAIKAELAGKDMGLSNHITDYWDLFVERIRKNLHVIMAFSPYGQVFKDSMISYPAIRNESTIDWYMPWSQNALESVARASLTKSGVVSPDNIKSIITVLVKMHKSVEGIADRFLKETKRFTAVTPSRYFELLATFSANLSQKGQETGNLINNYEGGVEKIKTTREQIQQMSKELDQNIPVLKKTRAECEHMLEELKVKSAEVEETRKEVEGQRENAEKEAEEATKANSVAQEQFKKAQPLLQEAQDAVLRLDKDSLSNIKKLHAPSSGMIDTFEAVCIMFGRRPRVVNGPTPGSKEEDYWPEVISLLNDIGFIKNVQNFRIEDLKKETINKLKKYVPTEPDQRAEKKSIASGSFAAVGALYDWVCASFDYWFVFQQILPLRNAAEEAAKKLEQSKQMLAKAQEHLDQVEATLKNLSDSVKAQKEKEKELAESVANTQARLERAEKIMSGLSGETARWEETAQKLHNTAQFILGDSLLISGVLTYIGVFSPKFRIDIINEWKGFLDTEKIAYTSDFSIQAALGNDGVIRDWIVKGLPNDTNSIENALIITKNQSFPLLIDPQLSGTKWLRAVEGEKMNVLQFDQSDFLQRLKSCVSFGLPVLIENVGLKLDPLLDPILSREIHNVDGIKRVSLGGESIAYSDSFRLYISTKYPNPHYSPEVCSQVSLINFTTTQFGLTDLLLNNLIEVERSDLDEKRVKIMEASAANTKKLKEIENEILNIVSNAGSDILDDDNAIKTLQKAQATSKDIATQMEASLETEKLINEFKETFSPVAERAALLYFCISDFSVIDPMYQFSLKWFVELFRQAIIDSPHPEDNEEKIKEFHQTIATHFYESVSYSLFSRHKLLFSTLMSIRIGFATKQISGSELAFMLSPPVSNEPNPTNFLPDDVWSIAVNLSKAAPVFEGLLKSLEQKPQEWANYMDSPTPETEKLPFDAELSPFEKLLVLRVFHLQRVREGLHIFIENSMGKEFVTPPTLKLQNVFKNSNPLSPLIFIIMPGIDPQDEIINVARTMEADKYFKSYSLGRGRGQGAEELIAEASSNGYWVLLQNCHLSLSWMPRLENIINNLDPKTVNPRFRICLVTMSSPQFPIGILYQGTKLIYEIPKGMRENVMRIYNGFNAEEYDSNENIIEKKLGFHLAFFHAVVLERLQFGSIGWNIPYEFNPSDYNISLKHLKIFLGESTDGEVPFEALSYVIGELNYGGRVTDRWDRRLLLSLLGRYFSPEVNQPNFSFGERYKAPHYRGSLSELLQIISEWPVVTAGVDVGLSKNASTIIARNEALSIFSSLIEVQSTLVAATDSISEEQFAINLVESLISDVPKPFNIFQFKKKFPADEMMTTVLLHEIVLYNNLIEVISESLQAMRNGLKGLIMIDERLETLNKRLLANKVPEEWLEKSFPSILNLRAYMADLKQRVAFLDNWVRMGAPVVYRLGAFFHPEEFLTAILQLYARSHSVPFDTLKWKTTCLSEMSPDKIVSEPEVGIYIEGLPLEGARWDEQKQCLAECGQRQLISSLPVMHLVPTDEKNLYDPNVTYECPVFRTQNRGTGALDLPNYIVSLFLPTPQIVPDHWIQRSVAAFITTQQ
ncbi:Dynein heavy chain family protein [Trichomonas vaginalis G3]|uniref:Dynein-1, subspecies f n=1 Tax=Trichomonas vaginalis (strain ATCC PRA-98 / G3) TaxID=412133 RepID=A2DDD3_TRIV3|nr:dynein heavy chain family protein family [Trichomonas vaginalis G3]EAY21612.1 Dynein heavy chain family protein [Trichomonas vaginalis G3]KAI5489712.1 dynein heavy chain family protein family [Trichomonas vaginalis G3]|eukprot:XP_001582598.1 Dynein heavy chain family protein [Trichomonas vaginalis G3]